MERGREWVHYSEGTSRPNKRAGLILWKSCAAGFADAQLAGASEGPFLQMIKRYWIEKDI
jgi:hypothetical protein